jgi:hypothetical protein
MTPDDRLLLRVRDAAVGSLHRLRVRHEREGDGPEDDLSPEERERLRVAYRSELERWEDGDASYGTTDRSDLDAEHDEDDADG